MTLLRSIAELDEVADYQLLSRLICTLCDRLLELAYRRIPLKDTCILTVDPLSVLVKRVCHIALKCSQSRNYMILFQLCDEIHTFLDLFLCILNSSVLYPGLAVLAL